MFDVFQRPPSSDFSFPWPVKSLAREVPFPIDRTGSRALQVWSWQIQQPNQFDIVADENIPIVGSFGFCWDHCWPSACYM
jgi:hypothetical protein